jgi:hypothetical protein
MAKDHGPSSEDDKQYEGLRNTDSGEGGTHAQKAAAGRKGGNASS